MLMPQFTFFGNSFTAIDFCLYHCFLLISQRNYEFKGKG